jgi:hypothetical protein
MLERDLYWAAGLLEGEGYFGVRRANRDLVIQVGMTDSDVIERMQRVLDCGSIKQRRLHSGKICHTLTIARQADAKRVMELVLPLMGNRRAERIRACLAARALVPPPRRDWTHCRRGHEFAGSNLRLIVEGQYTKRRCRACETIRTQQSRERKAA